MDSRICAPPRRIDHSSRIRIVLSQALHNVQGPAGSEAKRLWISGVVAVKLAIPVSAFLFLFFGSLLLVNLSPL